MFLAALSWVKSWRYLANPKNCQFDTYFMHSPSPEVCWEVLWRHQAFGDGCAFWVLGFSLHDVTLWWLTPETDNFMTIGKLSQSNPLIFDDFGGDNDFFDVTHNKYKLLIAQWMLGFLISHRKVADALQRSIWTFFLPRMPKLNGNFYLLSFLFLQCNWPELKNHI